MSWDKLLHTPLLGRLYHAQGHLAKGGVVLASSQVHPRGQVPAGLSLRGGRTLFYIICSEGHLFLILNQSSRGLRMEPRGTPTFTHQGKKTYQKKTKQKEWADRAQIQALSLSSLMFTVKLLYFSLPQFCHFYIVIKIHI